MKPKTYIRYIDFIVVLLSLDVLRFLLIFGLWAVFGPESEDAIATTLILCFSTILFWTKVGLAVLFFKNVPFRNSETDSVAFKKIWTMAFFWPLVLTK